VNGCSESTSDGESIGPSRNGTATLRFVAYQIRFSASAEEHFAELGARERSIVVDAVRKQLLHEPLRETRNRKPLRMNPLAPWELRVGALRVFYEVGLENPETVSILAIGLKRGNRLFVGGNEVLI
jgi:mRNA-degrading endonuclease RelE of RelBE toxin-antitoxin system